MGELYVSEILKYRTEIQSPVQLMKELLLRKFKNSGSELDNSNIVSAMMAQAVKASEIDHLPHVVDSNQPESMSFSGLPNRDLSFPRRGTDFPILNGQNMDEENQYHDTLMFESNPALLIEKQVATSSKKRDFKAEMKRRDSINTISELDTQNKISNNMLKIENKEPKSEPKNQKLQNKEPKAIKEKPSSAKRAPKKANQRVFLSKISNSKKQTTSKAKRICNGTEIEEFCNEIIEKTLNDMF